MSDPIKCKVQWSANVDKQLSKIPSFIRDKFTAWVLAVEIVGIADVRKRPGFHDEPLKGDRKGQRSIRLNKAYRAIYIEQPSGALRIIEVVEVSKHEY